MSDSRGPGRGWGAGRVSVTVRRVLRSGSMARPINEWMTKAQVTAALKVSERTVDRLHDRGQIQKQDRGNVPVFDPDDVKRLAKQKGLTDSDGQAGALAPIPNFERFMQAVAGRVEPEPEDAEAAVLPPSELRHKLYLTEVEAVRYTGLGKWFLAGKVKGITAGPNRSTVYRRADLDKL